ncbi:hypothetical protein, partial [Streptomyces sp. XY152]|uniref:hypothetical protein n=1 Tax=Streptomyces sp. XY152 TaxID=1415560 RepID=UPI0006C1682D
MSATPERLPGRITGLNLGIAKGGALSCTYPGNNPITHGELIRPTADQTMTVHPSPLQQLY